MRTIKSRVHHLVSAEKKSLALEKAQELLLTSYLL
jgi:hypothetical protein